MNPNTRVHLPFLDGIRGIAILGVFLCHSVGQAFGFNSLHWNGLFRDFDSSSSFLALYPLTYGSAGVAVFFVVSGFCIHLSHQRSKNKKWLLFINKRIFRIYPPYLLAVCLFFFVWPWGSFDVGSFTRAAQLITHILLIHNFDERTFFEINGSFWSIAVEVQLYAIYPLLLLFATKLGWKRALHIVAFLELSIRVASSVNGLLSDQPLPHFVIHSPFAYWLSWSIGAYLAQCFMENRTSLLFQVRFELIAVIAIVVPLFRPTEPFTFLAFSFLTAVVIERLMTARWVLPEAPLFQQAWSHLTLLGVVSYSFYLFHQPIIGLTSLIFTELVPGSSIHPLIKFSVCLAWYPIILLFSSIIYKIIEIPSIRLGKIVYANYEQSDKFSGK